MEKIKEKKRTLTDAMAIKEYYKLIEKLKKQEDNRKEKEDKYKIWIDYLDKQFYLYIDFMKTNEFEIIAKYNQKMYNKKLVLDRKYAKMINLRKEKLEFKKAKEIERFESKRKKSMDIELHNLNNKRQRKQPTDQTVSKVKAKALTEIQKYAKLSRAFLTDN